MIHKKKNIDKSYTFAQLCVPVEVMRVIDVAEETAEDTHGDRTGGEE